MNRVKKMVVKLISKPYFDLKKYYKEYRKVLNFLNPPLKPLYNTLDHKIMVKNREIPVRVFFPKEDRLPKAIVFFHGGGWVTGNIDTYSGICAQMANETKHIVVSVDYRLAPENPFPSGVEDCYYVTKEIFKNPHILKCKKEDITLVGDSAGANLAAVVSLMGRDRNEFFPSKQVLIYPATNYDHSESSPYPSVHDNGFDYIMTSKRIQDYLDLYVKKEEDKLNPYVAPILSEDLSLQPNTLIITAEFDPLRDEGEAYGRKLREFGNDVIIYRVKDALHGFFSNPISNEYISESYKIINSFLNDNIDEKSETNEV